MDHADTCGPANVEKVTPAFGQWQPIETAPKDGRDVLCWSDGLFIGAMVLYWMDGYWREKANCMGLKTDPDFWMPLPEAPDSDDRTVIQDGSVNQTALSKALNTPVSGENDGE